MGILQLGNRNTRGEWNGLRRVGFELRGWSGCEGVDELGERKIPVERTCWLSLPFSSVSLGSLLYVISRDWKLRGLGRGHVEGERRERKAVKMFGVLREEDFLFPTFLLVDAVAHHGMVFLSIKSLLFLKRPSTLLWPEKGRKVQSEHGKRDWEKTEVRQGSRVRVRQQGLQ